MSFRLYPLVFGASPELLCSGALLAVHGGAELNVCGAETEVLSALFKTSTLIPDI